MSLESDLKRLGRRDWAELLDLWIQFVPSITMPVVDPLTISDLPDLQPIPEEIIRTEEKSSIRDHYFLVSGLHSAMLSEAVVLFYKSLNAIGCTQLELDGGYKTWAVASAYQASYFSAKCLLNVLGVNLARVGNRELIVDILPSYSKHLKKRDVERRRSLCECRILRSHQLEHWEVWSVLQRILRTLGASAIPTLFLELIRDFEPKEFARQRNSILYHNTFWLYDDLRNRVMDPDFGCKSIDLSKDETEDDALTLYVAFLLLNSIYKLFGSLAERVPKFAVEFNLMKTALDGSDCNRYETFVSLNQSSL